MNSAYAYLQLYRLFDDCTPTAKDCGKLCNKACCSGDDCGMYLFPVEKKAFDLLKPDWASIDFSDLEYEHNGRNIKTPILFCNGKCDRYQRPLACRIFPLTPYLDKNGRLEIIIDPRARAVCPLAYGVKMDFYDKKFVKNVKRTFNVLSKNKEIYAFLNVYSRMLDEYLKFF